MRVRKTREATEAAGAEPITPVIFKREGRHIIAFFPALPGTGAHDVTCYAHVGQHSHAGLGYLMDCKPAKPAEYADLKRELERIGYRLEVVRRRTQRHDAARRNASNRES